MQNVIQFNVKEETKNNNTEDIQNAINQIINMLIQKEFWNIID